MSLIDRYAPKRWDLADIDFSLINKKLIRDDEILFLMLASASITEILSETYSRNLVEHFEGDTDLTGWLEQSWQKDEVQHGQALKKYVNVVWPEFDWDGAYVGFCREYILLCKVEQLEEKPALELVARCVVETGTSTFYRAILSYVREPVLRQILIHIMSDEVSHYANFRHFFEIYNARDRHGATAIMLAMWRRVREIGAEDAYIAFKHVHTARHPERPFRQSDWRQFNTSVKRRARSHYAYSMAAQMLVKPIPVYKPVKRSLQYLLSGLFRIASRA